MPSVSRRQHNYFEAISHDPAFAAKAGVKQSVANDFVAADKGRDLSKLPERVAKKSEGGIVGSAYPPKFVW